jgi:hypothetical protein
LIGRGTLYVFWLVALIPTLEWSEVRHELMKPGGGLLVPFFLLGVVGMAWADVSLLERWNGLESIFYLLVDNAAGGAVSPFRQRRACSIRSCLISRRGGSMPSTSAWPPGQFFESATWRTPVQPRRSARHETF